MEGCSEVLHYYPSKENSTRNKVFSAHGFFPVNSDYSVSVDYSSSYFAKLGEEDDVKRPMNSFLLWAKIMRRKYASENPNLHNAEISKLLGKIWNSMSVKDKRPFVERAEKLRVLHMRTYPNYRYAPKKRKDKKSQRNISPEIAAALHQTIFDVKNMLSAQHSFRDLNSYGYLREACENKRETEFKGDANENETSLKIAPRYSTDNPALDCTNNCDKPDLDVATSVADSLDCPNVITLHYFPTKTDSKDKEEKDKINEIEMTENLKINHAYDWTAEVLKCEDVTRILRHTINVSSDYTNKEKIDRVIEWCANNPNIPVNNNAELKMKTRNQTPSEEITGDNFRSRNEASHKSFTDDNALGDDIDVFKNIPAYNDDDTGTDGSHLPTIDDNLNYDLPDFLKTVLSRPFHYANITETDDVCLWSDIGEIISGNN